MAKRVGVIWVGEQRFCMRCGKEDASLKITKDNFFIYYTCSKCYSKAGPDFELDLCISCDRTQGFILGDWWLCGIHYTEWKSHGL